LTTSGVSALHIIQGTTTLNGCECRKKTMQKFVNDSWHCRNYTGYHTGTM